MNPCSGGGYCSRWNRIHVMSATTPVAPCNATIEVMHHKQAFPGQDAADCPGCCSLCIHMSSNTHCGCNFEHRKKQGAHNVLLLYV
jgi:hypothetical protein